MRRKDLNKQVSIYSIEPVSDGYGGYTTSATLVDTRWAKVEPLTPGDVEDSYGLQDANRTVKITIRKNSLDVSADNYFLYRNKTYKILSGPFELMFDNRFIEVVCQEQISKSNSVPVASATAPTITVTDP